MGMDISAGVTFICKLGVSEFPPILGPEAESLCKLMKQVYCDQHSEILQPSKK